MSRNENNKEFLSRYAINLNDRAKEGKLDPVIGRDEQIRRVLQILSRRTNSNIIGVEVQDKLCELANKSIEYNKLSDRVDIICSDVKDYCREQGFNTIDIDGVRVELDDGWALVRYSNTGPNITARFEGKTEEVMNKLKDTFMSLIEMYNK